MALIGRFILIRFTGNRISLISKKNIRYEGTLYSINESNATVALQNVRSYGTEGREKTDSSTAYVAPQDSVHPYLLFRGCDIKDLHVHEAAAAKPADDPAIVSNAAPPAGDLPAPPPPPAPDATFPAPPTPSTSSNTNVGDTEGKENEEEATKSQAQHSQNQAGRGSGQNRKPRKPKPAHQVGTGASLLNRKARGSVQSGKFTWQGPQPD